MSNQIRTIRDIGLLVRDARRKAGLTQADLARKVGAGVRWVHELEHGQPTVEAGRMLLVMNILGITLSVSPPDHETRMSPEEQHIDSIVSKGPRP